ncbi:hypothetical protein [Curtobacterium sp. MCBA15_004]|uniref:hypothetical protein n=1 Tax=unclassified Curtobacterium TaxID=257496 RepID=UPI0008DD2FB6|nr:hypothetical protein [Curtobacterium sp. MCBA15_004]WIA96624.1 hypothetical protein QOL16_16250 [Curtobacterium sp. MCBA15_004]
MRKTVRSLTLAAAAAAVIAVPVLSGAAANAVEVGCPGAAGGQLAGCAGSVGGGSIIFPGGNADGQIG